ncbi:MAG: hypothetical protein ACOC4L_01595 [Halanaerobium sp.]
MKYIKVKPNNRNYVTPEMISEAKIVIVKNENNYIIKKYPGSLHTVGDCISDGVIKMITDFFSRVLVYDKATRKIFKKNF